MSFARVLRLAFAALAAWAGLAGAALAQEPANRWGADYFPNVALTTHEGKQVKFYDDLLRGKAVAIAFIYTSCKDICPAETAALLQVYNLLGARVGRDVHMYSITIDPEHDTPGVLRAYRDNFQIGEGWTFLTGSRADIDLIQRRLGIRPARPDQPTQHSTSIVLGNEPMGRWIKRSPYDTPLVLANLLTETLQMGASAAVSGTRVNYASASAYAEMSKGEMLFRTRCVSCHTLGLGDRIGPDLAGVTQTRPHDWLRTFIKDPNKLLDGGDPTARTLLARYRGVRMPDLQLADADVSALLAFLEQEDRTRPGPGKPPGAPTHGHAGHAH